MQDIAQRRLNKAFHAFMSGIPLGCHVNRQVCEVFFYKTFSKGRMPTLMTRMSESLCTSRLACYDKHVHSLADLFIKSGATLEIIKRANELYARAANDIGDGEPPLFTPCGFVEDRQLNSRKWEAFVSWAASLPPKDREQVLSCAVSDYIVFLIDHL